MEPIALEGIQSMEAALESVHDAIYEVPAIQDVGVSEPEVPELAAPQPCSTVLSWPIKARSSGVSGPTHKQPGEMAHPRILMATSLPSLGSDEQELFVPSPTLTHNFNNLMAKIIRKSL